MQMGNADALFAYIGELKNNVQMQIMLYNLAGLPQAILLADSMDTNI